MDDRRVYEEIRALIEAHGGTMRHEKEGYQWGAWIVRVGANERIFHSNGSGYPELDQLYKPKPDIPNPNHWKDYSNTLIHGAWEKFVQLLSEDKVEKEKNMTVVDNRYRGKKEYSLVYTEMITAARYRGTVTYQEIAQIMGLPLQGSHMGMEVGWILGEISDDEVANGRPMLSAIVVNVQGLPGPGFFTLARQLGKLQDDNEQAFWERERQLVYETWKVVLR